MATAIGSAPASGRFGLLAYAGAGLSLAFCFWKASFGVVAPFLGVATFEINPHVQAVIMWLFAALAVYGLYRGRQRHGSTLPLALGIAALAIIIGTLYTYYADTILAAGYVILLVAALLNQNRMLLFLNDKTQAQALELQQLNATLEARVETQVAEINRMTRLKRFLAQNVASMLVDDDREAVLESHRAYIVCVFADIRRFTALTESMEPEDVINVIREFHAAADRCVERLGGTIGYRAGDGLLVFFNDPVPCDEPDRRAVDLALEIRVAFDEINAGWRRFGADVGLAIGIASGYATMGVIGVEGRWDYTPIGAAVNLAARLSDRAQDGQILLSARTRAALDDDVATSPLGPVTLRGVSQPVEVFALESVADA